MAGQAFFTSYALGRLCIVVVITVSHIIHIAHVSASRHLMLVMHLAIRHGHRCHAL